MKLKPMACASYVVSCRCGAKRLCRHGLAYRVCKHTGRVFLDETRFTHGLPSPISEEQHFLMLHKDCP